MKEFKFPNLLPYRKDVDRAKVLATEGGITVIVSRRDGRVFIGRYDGNVKASNNKFDIVMKHRPVPIEVSMFTVYEELLDFVTNAIMYEARIEVYDEDGFQRLCSNYNVMRKFINSRADQITCRPVRKQGGKYIFPIHSNHQKNVDWSVEAFNIGVDNLEAQSIICIFTHLLSRVNVNHRAEHSRRNGLPHEFNNAENAREAFKLVDYLVELGFVENDGINILRSLSDVIMYDDDDCNW